VGFFALLISWVVWLVVQVPKYRRSGGERRLQLKWLYSGAVVFVICLAVSVLEPIHPSSQWRIISAVVAPGIAALPVALGIGFDTDRRGAVQPAAQAGPAGRRPALQPRAL
jgi:hypothetical protein